MILYINTILLYKIETLLQLVELQMCQFCETGVINEGYM